MIVYRYLSNEELKCFMGGRIDKLGTIYNSNNPNNTHKYKKNIRYLHFFKHLRDFPLIQKFAKSQEGKFICKFDIPLRTLITRKGTGAYQSLKGGYDYDSEYVKEFAVEVNKMRPEYLVDFIFDEHSDLTVEEVEEIFTEQESNEPER